VRICFAKQLNNAITPLKRAGFLCESWKASTTKKFPRLCNQGGSVVAVISAADDPSEKQR
jgi:hypothetical protein